MSKQSLDENYFDMVLDQVLQDMEDEEIEKSAALYQNFKNLPEIRPSLRHRHRMKKLIKQAERESRSTNIPYSLKRIFIPILVVVTIIFSTGVFASANIVKLFHWFGFYTEDYVDISISRHYTERIRTATKNWPHGNIYVPTLIPDGYELEDIDVYEKGIIIVYTSPENHYLRFNIKILGLDTIASSDNSSDDFNRLKIDGYDASYVENEKTNVLAYNTNEYYFSLTSDFLNQKELKKIAEHIQILPQNVVN